jgi:MFS family permease
MIIGILGPRGAICGVRLLPAVSRARVAVNVLHGIAYAFFFATVYIFVDEFFPKDARAQRAGTLQPADSRLRSIVANTLGPILISQTFNHGGLVDFRGLFLVAADLCDWCRDCARTAVPSADKAKTRVGVPVTSH